MPIAKPVNSNATRPYPPQNYNKPPLIIILTIIVLVVFFIGFFALYFCKCFIHTLTEAWNHHYHNESPENQQSQPDNQPPVNPGLEPHVIQSFPSFPFSSVKDVREDKYSLECAICLLEFEEEEILLRLLTTCYHVFHQECIDLWLESHKTCPVCRRNLDPNAPENIKELIIEVIQENAQDNQNQTTISNNEVALSRQSSNHNERKIETLPDKFSRSKTTGHSIVRNKPEEEDRYTLRLPDHVKIKVTRRHNSSQTESCISFGELIRNRGSRFGEVSGQITKPESDHSN